MGDYPTPFAIPQPALALGIAGLLPFAVLALLLWFPQPSFSPDAVLAALMAYGAVTVASMGGVRWGFGVGPYGYRRRASEFSIGLLSVLAGWGALLMPAYLGLSLLIAGFFLLALWDVLSVEDGRLPQWFGKLRSLISASAVVTLIAALMRTLT